MEPEDMTYIGGEVRLILRNDGDVMLEMEGTKCGPTMWAAKDRVGARKCAHEAVEEILDEIWPPNRKQSNTEKGSLR